MMAAILKVRHIYRSVLAHSLQWLNRLLHVAECNLSRSGQEPLEYVPIFIIGAPRSGSTLLYQAMTEYYDFGYLSNLHCRFYGSPSLTERLYDPLQWRQPSVFTSTHGRTLGRSAPSECGEYWYRFFRRKPQYVPLEEADPQKMRQLRASIRALGNAFGKPILFKNLMCTLRLEPINFVFPEALFIVIRRDVIDNAQSLLKGRQKVYGDYSHWWSAEPSDIEQLKRLPPHEQVVEQVRHIDKLIEDDRKNIGENRFFDVQYESFCSDVAGTLAALDQFFSKHVVSIKKRNSNIPTSFERNRSVNIDTALYQKVVCYVRGQ